MKACIILIFTTQNQDEQIKEDEMGRAYSTDDEMTCIQRCGRKA
jgi:hypothetical protein